MFLYLFKICPLGLMAGKCINILEIITMYIEILYDYEFIQAVIYSTEKKHT